MGNGYFIVGNDCFIMGNGYFIVGNDCFIMGNGCFIVGNDENGGTYIGKCSTQTGNY